MSRVTLEDFIRAWQDKISKIEKMAFDDYSVRRVRADFEINRLEIKMSLREEDIESGGILKLDTLKSELEAALETANSRFKTENLGVVTRPNNAFNGMFEKVYQ